MAIRYVSLKYGADADVMIKVANCESGIRHDVFGDNGKAFGIYQYWKGTFKQYCEGSYYSAKDQIDCAVRMINEGQGSHWSCYRRL
jgi:hypothetical protein